MANMTGSPILIGKNTVPGVAIPPEIKEQIPTILNECREFGLDFYPTVIQFLTYDEMSEIAAYGGFPVRYPHWKWGMEYEELSRGYEYGLHRIYEMVINTNPCYIYCLNSNTMVDNITVIAHATGHNDFFKNNIYFSPTSQNMMNQLANHGTRIRKYMSRWGKERVMEFIDYVLRLSTLVDPAEAWKPRKVKEQVMRDSREFRFPQIRDVPQGHDYMDSWINTKDRRNKDNKRIERQDMADEIDLFKNPTRDILGYLRDNAPLRPWQADIVALLYDEAIYFSPQRGTKMLNEGWASYLDDFIMTKKGFASLGQKPNGSGIIEYAKHKAGVLGTKYSMNPYKVGFTLFKDVEERWNKGRFGTAYDECDNIVERDNWDTGANLGREKIFELRKYYDDASAINEFFTSDFCNKHEFFEWEKRPNGEYVILSRDHEKIKRKLMMKYLNGGLPDIRLVDSNHRGKRWFLLQHQWDGRPLYIPYVQETLTSIYKLWGENVVLASRTTDGQEEVVCVAYGEDAENDTVWLSRKDYEEKYK